MSEELRELERAIVADPDDQASRLVYADALQEAGDPRGEHIALALAAATGDLPAASRARALETKAARRIVKSLRAQFVVRLRWRLGLVDAVHLEQRRGESQILEEDALAELLRDPALLALRALDLRVARTRSPVYEMVPRVVQDRPVRWIGFYDQATSTDADKLIQVVSKLFATLPRLDGLGLVTASPVPVLEALRDQPRLRGLDLSGGWFAEPIVDHLLALPAKLQRLVVHSLDGDWLGPVMEGKVYPELEHLGVFCSLSPTVLMLRELLGDSALLPRLATLGFRAGQVYDDEETRTWLVDQRAALAHVQLFAMGASPGEDNGFEVGRLGWLYNKLDRPRDAIDELAHHLDHCGAKGDHAVCYSELGASLFSSGDYEGALVPVDKAIALYGNTRQPDLLGNASYSWRLRVHALDRLERHDEQLIACDRALEFEPANAWTMQFYGSGLRDTGRPEEALAMLERAVETCLTVPEQRKRLQWSRVMRANLLFGMRRFEEARPAFMEVVAGDDVEATIEALENLGAMARHHGDLVAAKKWYEDAASRSAPTHSKAIDYVALMQFELGRRDQALATWQRAAAEFTWSDIDEQGHVLLALGRPEDALAVLDAGLEIGGARACALHTLGRTDEAIKALDGYGVREQLSQRVCTYRHVVGCLLEGLFHRAAGRTNEAKPLLARARPKPQDPLELHDTIARVMRRRADCASVICGRRAAVVAIISALAAGKRDEAIARIRVLDRGVTEGYAYRLQLRMWEARAALAFLDEPDAKLAATCIQFVERCGGPRPIE